MSSLCTRSTAASLRYRFGVECWCELGQTVDMSTDQYPASRRRLGLNDALQHPCSDCSAGCCIYVPLRDFVVRELTELDYARYLLNFDRIEITLHASGLWRAHYVQPCRYLDLDSLRCRVHGTDRQPLTCKSFNAWQCSYKRIYDAPENGEAIRLDARRLDAYAAMLEFDGYRRIVAGPDMDTLRAELPPLLEPDWPSAPRSTVLERWIQETQAGTEDPQPVEYGFQKRPDPCTDCSAWCCTRLSFPQTAPSVEANLEYLRFLVGFDGIELGFSPEGWTAVVRTQCRHRVIDALGNGRCGVYGQPERPLACQTYQAASCAYKSRFGRPRPASYLRIDGESLDGILALYRVDEQGTIRSHPEYHQVHSAVMSGWMQRAIPESSGR